MRICTILFAALLIVCSSFPCTAQSISVSTGVLFTQSNSSTQYARVPLGTPPVTFQVINKFNNSLVVAGDVTIPVYRFIAAAAHYSYSHPDDLSSVEGRLNLDMRNVAFEGRVRTPALMGWRLYGFAGGGVTHFSASSIALALTRPMFTFGGGVERNVLPLIRLKIEARDYRTSGIEGLQMPSGSWHRTAILAGVVIGRQSKY